MPQEHLEAHRGSTRAAAALSPVSQTRLQAKHSGGKIVTSVRPRPSLTTTSSAAGQAAAVARANGCVGSAPAARPVVVIGAGPYGLSAAAHLIRAGVSVRVFGEP